MGICSLYTTVASFWSFRSWPYLSAGIGIAAVITAFQMKVQFHPFLFALFLIVGLFQVSVASYVAFVSKKEAALKQVEPIVFKLFFSALNLLIISRGSKYKESGIGIVLFRQSPRLLRYEIFNLCYSTYRSSNAKLKPSALNYFPSDLPNILFLDGRLIG
ncbi:hypothetical protein OM428_10990 [Enterococcus gallinarum]|nr:hypothetical protein [Enterococcus gallinarum]MCW3745221.1 hypothetical protein [Enterococcus gallinarum]